MSGCPSHWLTIAAATLGSPGVAVPLYAIEDNCADPRYPSLAGDWVVACGKKGQIDRLVHLPSGRVVKLPAPLDPRRTGASAGTVPGTSALVQIGGATRVVVVSEHGAQELEGITRLPGEPVGLPATDGVHLVAALDGRVEALVATDKVRPSWPADTIGWQGLAMSWPWVAWVELGRDGSEDVWALEVGGADPTPIAHGPGEQRLVVSDGPGFALVDDGDVVRWRPDAGVVDRITARTGFLSAPTASGGAICWEQRVPEHDDIDIVCTDSLGADGPEDQLRPSRSGPWLLYRQAGRTWLATSP